ncbi:arylformamidase [Bacillus spongiae]|uniref:Kynurenine formamidase n=1 Tax=Bacillus spongiae TaxID=2683610 RepID=A0ABU8HG91_9BACI
MKLYDISRKLHQTTAVWPGDTPYSFDMAWTKLESGSVNVGKVEMSVHSGTHVDAPYHFDEEGKKIDELDLTIYWGTAKVVDVSGQPMITKELVDSLELDGVQRVLFKTNKWTDTTVFPEVIPPIESGVANCLVKKGVLLIGVDVPSVDPISSKELVAHHELNQCKIHILEGIDLTAVQPRNYELVAMPLPIAGGDGSPVRAVLRELKYEGGSGNE